MLDRTHGKEIALRRERCFLAAVVTPERNVPGEDPLDELARLVDTAGGEEAGRLTQRMERVNSRTYFGKGKLSELAVAIKNSDVDTLVIDDDISPKQLSALEDASGRKVIDRNEVILDIFQARARSYQAQLQVELAQLQYELPRLVRKWTHLERLGGGIGTRGPGESQLETDRRIIRSKIKLLRDELDVIEARREREVGKRDAFSVCLVGYTNAGKSSLMNRLTRADAFVEDRLFATIDTATRRLDLGDNLTVLLSDTVGFIRRLPHHLVASFHATLTEASEADLLLHVVDASDPFAIEQLKSVDETLKSLGMEDTYRAYVLNKVDCRPTEDQLTALKALAPVAFPVSARTGEGIDDLLSFIRVRAVMGQKLAKLRFSAADGRRFALVNEITRVHEVNYEDSDVLMTVQAEPLLLDRIRRLPGDISIVME